jgi:hypothetical protein
MHTLRPFISLRQSLQSKWICFLQHVAWLAFFRTSSTLRMSANSDAHGSRARGRTGIAPLGEATVALGTVGLDVTLP